MISVSAPRDAAPSRAFSSSVAVFHFFLGLPLNAITFIPYTSHCLAVRPSAGPLIVGCRLHHCVACMQEAGSSKLFSILVERRQFLNATSTEFFDLYSSRH